MPDTPLRPDLEALPRRLQKLPVDARGYPVPWFVGWVDGVPDFRCQDPRKFSLAVNQRVCWVCGEPLGRWLAFPIGPMCSITRTISEPPSHLECAEWSARNCPFLANPRMERRTEDLPADHRHAPGLPILRNPGALCVWVTRSYEVFPDANRRPLITIGEPERTIWYYEGRLATRAEVEAAVHGGLPTLLATAKTEGPFAVQMLGRMTERASRWWPVDQEAAVDGR